MTAVTYIVLKHPVRVSVNGSLECNVHTLAGQGGEGDNKEPSSVP